MDAVGLIVGCSWIIISLLITGLAIPLVRGQIGRNPIYGIRFPQSLSSDEAWFAINHFGGKRLIMWAVPLFIVGLLSLFLPPHRHPALALTLGLAPLVFVLAPVWQTWQFARQYHSNG